MRGTCWLLQLHCWKQPEGMPDDGEGAGVEESPHVGVVISAEGHKEEYVIDCTRSSLFLIND